MVCGIWVVIRRNFVEFENFGNFLSGGDSRFGFCCFVFVFCFLECGI